MSVVYVLSKDGKPLMPTTRCGHVRILLKTKKARVVQTVPFVIRLNYETEDIVQSLVIGMDPGRTNIGMAVVRENGECVFSAQVHTRNKRIPKLMKSRKQYRQAHRRLKRRCKRQRRAKRCGTVVKTNNGIIERILPGCKEPILCKSIRNKEARFNNRKRPVGWLTPTANQLLQTHYHAVQKVMAFLPIAEIVLELNRFAFMQMDNPKITRKQYQRGPLFEKGSVKAAVSEMQDGKCLLCKKPIEHYHHVMPRNKNGSNTLTNIVGLCAKHHEKVHTDSKVKERLLTKTAGLHKKYHALSVLNQIIPRLTIELSQLAPTSVTTDKDTSDFRKDHGIEKDHHLDAYCIACSTLEKIKPQPPKEHHTMLQFRRHDRQACHQCNEKRIYMLDGKKVAVNRHKAFEQTDDSLEEYRKQPNACVDRLKVKHIPPIYKRKDRIMPGAIFRVNGKRKVMTASKGLHNGIPDYYTFADGTKATPKKCELLAYNQGLCFTE